MEVADGLVPQADAEDRPRRAVMMAGHAPDSLGVQGPGEITRCVGANANAPCASMASLRMTSTFSEGSISPKRWTRFQVNES
jgi:hypothetical protein